VWQGSPQLDHIITPIRQDTDALVHSSKRIKRGTQVLERVQRAGPFLLGLVSSGSRFGGEAGIGDNRDGAR